MSSSSKTPPNREEASQFRVSADPLVGDDQQRSEMNLPLPGLRRSERLRGRIHERLTDVPASLNSIQKPVRRNRNRSRNQDRTPDVQSGLSFMEAITRGRIESRDQDGPTDLPETLESHMEAVRIQNLEYDKLLPEQREVFQGSDNDDKDEEIAVAQGNPSADTNTTHNINSGPLSSDASSVNNQVQYMKPNAGLSPEIWGVICCQLLGVSKSALLSTARVSSLMKAAAIPHIYEEIKITRSTDLKSLQNICDHGTQHVRNYTVRFLVDAEIPMYEDEGLFVTAANLLNECHNLKSFWWYDYNRAETDRNSISDAPSIYKEDRVLPDEIQNALKSLKSDFQLHLDINCNTWHDSSVFFWHTKPDSLDALNYSVTPGGYENWKPEELGVFLAKCTKLKTLMVATKRGSSGRGRRWALPLQEGVGKFPAVQHLHLRDYDWPFKQNHYENLWDFTNLRTLKLDGVPFDNFLTKVPLDTLFNLTTLKLAKNPAVMYLAIPLTLPDLNTELWPWMQHLESLAINLNWSAYFDFAMLSTLGPRLRELDLSMVDGFGEHNQQTCLSSTQLEHIRQTCSNLRSLGASLEVGCSLHVFTQQYIKVICRFRNLLHLRLDFCSPESGSTCSNKYYSKAEATVRTIIAFGTYDNGEKENGVGESRRLIAWDLQSESVIHRFLALKEGLEFSGITILVRRSWGLPNGPCSFKWEERTDEIVRSPGNTARHNKHFSQPIWTTGLGSWQLI